MASVATKKHFLTIPSLRLFSPSVLAEFLHHFPDYLQSKKLQIPEPSVADTKNMPYAAVQSACVAADIDEGFNRILFMASKLGDQTGLELIEAEMKDRGATIDFDPDEFTPYDFPLVVWLRRETPAHDDILEQSYARGHIHSKSSYRYYAPLTDRRTKYKKPTPEMKADIRDDLAEHFTGERKNPRVKVFDYDFEEEIWFMIRYPGQPVRPDAVATDGDYEDLQYTPGHYDAVVYHKKYGDLRMNTVRKSDHTMYRITFGHALLDEMNMFDPKKKIITLATLKQDCRHFFATEDAGPFPRLRPTEICFNDIKVAGRRITWRCDSGIVHLFQYPTGRKKNRLLPTTADTIHYAKIQYRLDDKEGWHSMTVHQGMDLRFERDGDSADLEGWLRERGFIIDVLKKETKPKTKTKRKPKSAG